MEFVNEEDDASFALANLRENGLESFLKLLKDPAFGLALVGVRSLTTLVVTVVLVLVGLVVVVVQLCST